MGWIRKDMPVIEGYEAWGDNVISKRWVSFKLSELLDTENPVWEFRDEFKTRKEVCEFVITEFDYPFHHGVPTDVHRNNWFHGLCCHQITEDYWQTASETLTTLKLNSRLGKKGLGDCEDVATLATTLFLEKKWKVYECLGVVLEDDKELGGHAWVIWEDKDGQWRLLEATLSIPPSYPDGYVPIDPEQTEWVVNGLTYRAFVKFNRHEYYESENGFGKYFTMKFNAKETRKKHEAISRAWMIKTKAARKLGLLAKLRWR
jgi:hypothetical protein